jgi:glutathionylspermidine synthase
MHYRRGVSTIHDMIHQKLLRAQSLLEVAEQGNGVNPNFESLEDTYKDMINYCSFAVAYMRGRMEGQTIQRDMLNRVATHSEAPKKQLLVEDVGDRIEADFKSSLKTTVKNVFGQEI